MRKITLHQPCDGPDLLRPECAQLKPVGRMLQVNTPAAGPDCHPAWTAVDRKGIALFIRGMNVRIGKKRRYAGGSCIAICTLVFAAGSWAASTPIYKCLDKNLGLLYTDQPCKDGEQLDIRPGDADPAAVARLERQRDALDQDAARRIAALRQAPVQGQGAPRLRYDPVDQSGSYDYEPAYVADYGTQSRPSTHRHPKQAPPHPRIRHFAPAPPDIVPRS